MAGAAAAAVWVDVLPSMAKFGTALTAGVRKPAVAGGAAAGKAMGQSVTTALSGSLNARAAGAMRRAQASMRPAAVAAGTSAGTAMGTAASTAAGTAMVTGSAAAMRKAAAPARTAAAAAGTSAGTAMGAATGRAFGSTALAGIGGAFTSLASRARAGGAAAGAALTSGVRSGAAGVGGALSTAGTALGGFAGKAGKAAQTAGGHFTAMNKRITGAMNGVNQRLSAFGFTAGQSMGIAGGAAVIAGVKYNAFKEQSEMAFSKLLGSGEKAREFMGELSQFAATTPFDMPGVVSAAQQLSAYGVKAGDVIPTLRTLGDAAAATGRGAEGMSALTRAFGQMTAKGKVQTEELLQMQEVGVPAMQILANQLGLSVEDMQDQVSKGMVKAGDALPLLMRGMETGTNGVAGQTQALGGMMEAQAQTTTGKLSNLKDNFMSFMGGMTETLMPIIDGIVSGLNVMLPVLRPLAPVFIGIAVAIGLWTVAQWALNSAMFASPIFWIIAAIVALVAGFVLLWTKCAWFRDFWIMIWNGIKTAVMFVWQSILQPVFSAIGVAFSAIGTALSWVWTSILQPVFTAIGIAFQAVGTALSWVWTSVLEPVFNAIGAVLSWVWNNIISPILTVFQIMIGIVFGIIAILWETVLKPVFDAIGAVIGWVWNNIIKPTFDAWMIIFGAVGAAGAWMWNNVLKPAFEAIGSFLSWVWNTLIKPVWDAFLWALDKVGAAGKWLYENILKPAFDGIGNALRWVWDNVLAPVFDWFKEKFEFIGKVAEKQREIIKQVFDKIVDAVKKPIQLVIDVVWNNGLRLLYNKGAELVGWDTLPELKLPGMARGGVLPGYAPGKDTVAAMLSPGEGVLVPELVRMIGAKRIDEANKAAMAGRGGFSGAGHFAAGGIVAGAAVSASQAAPQLADASAAVPGTEALTAATDLLALSMQNLQAAGIEPVAAAITTVYVPALQLAHAQITAQNIPALVSLQQANDALRVNTIVLQVSVIASWNTITANVLLSHQKMRDSQTGLAEHINVMWGWIAGSVWASVNNQHGAFGSLEAGLAGVRDAMKFTAEWAEWAFRRIWPAAADPTRDVLHRVFNEGLIAAWNKLDADFDFKKHVPPVAVPFATGGRVFGTGNKDSIPAMLTPGEYVFSKPAVRQLGAGNVEAMHQAARSGESVVPGFAGGGMVWPILWDIIRGQFPAAIKTSEYRPGEAGSYHGTGNAVDVAGPMPLMQDIQNWLVGTFGKNSAEIIGPTRQNIKDGRPLDYGPATTAQHMNHVHWAATGTPQKGGIPGFGVLNPEEFIGPYFEGAFNAIDDYFRRWGANKMAEQAGHMGKQAGERMKTKAIDMFGSLGAGGGAGVERWRPLVLRALAMVGQPASLADVVLRRMMQESGGDPGIQNNWDINAINGTPSGGLMQVIGPTFAAYRHPGLPNNLFDPLANIVASMRYCLATYGSLPAGYNRPGGYDSGGWLPPGPNLVYNGTRRPEPVLSPQQWDDIGHGGERGRPIVIHVHPREGQSEEAIAQIVNRRLGRTMARR